jgi:hypothetical protein
MPGRRQHSPDLREIARLIGDLNHRGVSRSIEVATNQGEAGAGVGRSADIP